MESGHDLVLPQQNVALQDGPLDRLDAMLAPTTEWARLREILSSRPAWVQDAVSNALCDEVARSCRNIVEQFRTTRDIMEQMQETLSSDDALAVGNMLHEIHPSSIRGLERAADEVEADIRALRNDLQNEDFETMESRAKRISMRAKRFRDRYAAFRPSLVRLQQRLQELAVRCEQQESRSAELIAETESRREWWWRLLTAINWVLVGGGVIMLGGAAGTVFVVKHILMTKASALCSGKAALAAAKATAAEKTAAAAAAQAASAKAAAAAGSGAASSSAAGVGVATAAGATGAGAAAAAGVGAPAATVLGSELLGSMAVSAGLMATPAAPAAAVVGIGAAAAAGATLLWHAVTASSAATAAAAAAKAAAEAVAAQAAADVAAAHVASAAGVVSSLQTSIVSLSAVVSVATPFVVPAALVLALGLLGFAGRDLIKSLLGQLWEAEIERHQETLDWARQMKLKLREAAEKLLNVREKNDALTECLDMVVEAADTIGDAAEDAQVMPPEPNVLEQIERLLTVYERVPSALRDVHQALQELQAAARDNQAALPGQGEVDGHSLVLADRGQSLPSPPFTNLSPTAAGCHDCLPRNSALLVTVESAATADRLLAAGPSDYVEVQVRPQGCTRKRMATFCLGGHGGQVHCFTADHPLQVMRSGSWIHEQACMLRVGDVITTTRGQQTLQSEPRIYDSLEQVYNLQVFSDAEVFVHPGSGGEGVAVLGSLEDSSSGSSTRSVSSPPELGQLPSEGSRHCRGDRSCTNVCRKFIRGNCSEGSNCRFCHRSHPEERRRAPRGPRSQSRSSGSA